MSTEDRKEPVIVEEKVESLGLSLYSWLSVMLFAVS